jgi:hypothetical protein
MQWLRGGGANKTVEINFTTIPLNKKIISSFVKTYQMEDKFTHKYY